MAKGVTAQHLTSVFPSKTFPNHWSIITGLLPESHGIIANRMYDPEIGGWFTMSTKDPRWWLGEPVWITAKRHGIDSGVAFWPGSEVTGRTPTYYLPYDQSMPYSARVSKMLSWLSLPKTPRFCGIYFEGVDSYGHAFGPDSSQAEKAIEDADVAVGQIVAGLKSLEKKIGPATVILVSDHGMAAVDSSRVVSLEDDCGATLVGDEIVGLGAVMLAQPNDVDRFLNATRNCSAHMKVFRKSELPERFHYQHSSRIPEVVGSMDSGWEVVLNRNSPVTIHGDHGFDPLFADMRAVFVAAGPGVHSDGRSIPAVSNLDVYQLISNLLGITPASNNGTGLLSALTLDDQ